MRKNTLLFFCCLLICILSHNVLAIDVTTTNGWEIETDQAQTKILFPEIFHLAIDTTDGAFKPCDGFELYKTRWIGKKNLQGENTQVHYLIQLAGFTFEGTGIAFNGSSLYLKKIWINVPNHFWYNSLGEEFAENKQFVFSNVQIAPDGKAIGMYIDAKSNCSLYSYWVLKLNEIYLDENGLGAFGIAYLNCNIKTIPVSVTLNIDTDFIPQQAKITEKFNYDIAKDGLFTIQNAELCFEWFKNPEGDLIPTESLISVHKAKFTFYDSGIQLEFGNLTIDDLHMAVTKSGDFYLQPIPFMRDGVSQVYEHYLITTGTSGIFGWLKVETSPDTVITIEH